MNAFELSAIVFTPCGFAIGIKIGLKYGVVGAFLGAAAGGIAGYIASFLVVFLLLVVVSLNDTLAKKWWKWRTGDDWDEPKP